MNYASASFILTMGLTIWLISILAFWQLFEKAGIAGWKSIVPIYSSYLLSVIAGQSVLVWVLSFLPVVGIIGVVMIALGTAKAFGKSTAFAIFGLVIFSYFGYMMLGWGKSQYQKQPEIA